MNIFSMIIHCSQQVHINNFEVTQDCDNKLWVDEYYSLFATGTNKYIYKKCGMFPPKIIGAQNCDFFSDSQTCPGPIFRIGYFWRGPCYPWTDDSN